VGITGIKDRNEVNEILNLLQQTEISVVWLIRMEPRKQKTVLSEQQIKISKTKETTGVSTASARSFAIQTGAFRQEVNAQAYRNKVAGMVDKQVVTVSENGFFKVRIIGFESSQEAQSYASKIKGLGLSQIQVVPVKIQEELIPEIQQPVIEPKPGEAKPAFALQAGVFTSRSQAVAAQKKINSALGLPVEIVEQWDYYRVIITGFATREETYKYYPELAGLGYSKISVIETK
jgi:cell division protein FtsN